MIVAETIATGINWSLIATLVMAIGTFGMWIDGRRSRKTVLEQPVDVRLVKALHEEFAQKAEFEQLVNSNTQRHSQIFKRIEDVEREARVLIGAEVSKINLDRQRTMEKLNEQFTFIRESLASINTELKINRESNQ